jgi:formyltetrahydrofolate synthetase
MYGAEKVEFSELAQKKVNTYQKQGFGNLPICIAKHNIPSVMIQHSRVRQRASQFPSGM